MRNNRQWILFAAGISACIAAFALGAIRPGITDLRTTISIVLLILGIASLSSELARNTRFHSRLRRFVGHLLRGNYEVGFRESKTRDGIADLERDLEKLGEQLRTYDQLRADRVRLNQHLLDLLLEHVTDPIMLLDVQSGNFECNPAAQKALGVSQHEIALGAIKALPENSDFVALLNRVIETDQSAQEALLRLQLPGADSTRGINARLYPVKDRHEDVLHVLIIGYSIDDS